MDPTAIPSPAPTPSTVTELVGDSIALASDTTSRLLTSLPLVGTRLLFAAIAIIAGFLILRVGKRVLDRVLRRKSRQAGGRTVQQRETLRSLLESVLSYMMYFIIATVVLSIFGVNISSIIAVAGVGGVAISFGAQTLVKDIISGIFLWAEGNITVGDTIAVNSMTGTVESISLRTTSVRDYNGNLYVVPNGDIRTVTNMSRGFTRALVDVRLNYEEDLEYQLSVLRDEAEKSKEAIPGLMEVPQVLGITAMAGDSITVQVAARCEQDQAYGVERELRRRIKTRFDAEKILFPHGPVMPTPRTDQTES